MSNTPAAADSRSPGTEDTAVAVLQPDTAAKAFVGRSPGQLAWIRLKRDRTAFASFIIVVFFILIALFAPVISRLYGVTATEGFSDKLTYQGLPTGYLGGISGDHWLGLEAGIGRDLFMQLIFGMRTSLIIAFLSAIISIVLGVVLGIVSGYFGGWVDQSLTWFTDFMLAFPFLVFALAIIPIINTASYDVGEEVPGSFRIAVIIGVFALFGWMTTARLVRGQILSLREREYVEAARAAGAGSAHILFKQLLPNIWAPILVSFSLALPGFIAAEAALSFLNIGVVEPTPDLGRLVYYGRQWLGTPDWAYFLIPASTVFVAVLAFNLLGDSLRDALDPKSSK
ncbi:ABC transporter permease [Actinoplanes derwentensis]|uniref:Peptide/nickel transport system permease protein n=1 Tax=Actinoplanes derwentensis TaxID=113562 RepID=A0A1H2D7P3_9ACTN|nr:ABC transporter permease [Actinoplanes derwentensis]GID89395.1 peptide ABC transporter permease [Actinoplanes derwentensis]SDT78577.1 peptide/nickel transport system permease protein [Actinoplanes derwentensis]